MSRLSVFLMFAGSLALLSCKKEEPLEEEVVTYELGQEHLGGIIVELDETKQHGLVVAKVDQVTYNDHINWSDSKEQVEAYTVGGTGWRLPANWNLSTRISQPLVVLTTGITGVRILEAVTTHGHYTLALPEVLPQATGKILVIAPFAAEG